MSNLVKYYNTNEGGKGNKAIKIDDGAGGFIPVDFSGSIWFVEFNGETAGITTTYDENDLNLIFLNNAFSVAPTVDVSYVNLLTASNNQIIGLYSNNTYLVYSASLNFGQNLTYNGQTKIITEIYTNLGATSTVSVNSLFSGNLTAKVIGTDITVSSPVPNQIVSVVNPNLLYVISSSVGLGDELTYNGETKTVDSITPGGNYDILALDSAFTEDLTGLVIGTDITIGGGGGGGGGGGVPSKPEKPAVAKPVKPEGIAEITKPEGVAQISKPSGVAKITKG